MWQFYGSPPLLSGLRSIVKSFCLCLLFAQLMGCRPENLAPLRIGSNVWPGYETLYLARTLGLYHLESIRLVEYTSTSEVMAAFQEGEIEVAAVTLDEALSLLNDGIRLKVVLVMNFSNGSDALIAKEEIQSVGDLRGKRIAVEFNTAGGFLLISALEAADLEPTDVQIIQATSGEHMQAFESADAVVCFEPTVSKLVAKGGKRLYDSSMMPGMIVNVLIIRHDAPIAFQQALNELITGYFAARDYLLQNPEQAFPIVNQRLELELQQLYAIYQTLHLPGPEENRQLLRHDDPKLKMNAEQLQDYLLGKQMLRRQVPLDDFSTAAFIPLNANQ